jgi:hypothetical protein
MALTGFTDFTPAYIEQYETGIILTTQQKKSKLLPFLEVGTQDAKTQHYSLMGSGTLTTNAAKGATTVFAGGTVSSRSLTLTRLTYADLIARDDIIKLGNMKPDANVIESAARKFGQKVDSLILSALTGNAVADTGNVALPAGNTIAVDYEVASTNTALTMAKIRAAVQKFDEADVDENDRIAVVAPGALQSLLKDSTVTSADFNNIKPLVDGSLTHWMGMTWIKSNQVAVSSNIHSNVFFQKSALKSAWGVGDGVGMTTTINQSGLYNTDYSIIVDGYFGALRLEEVPVYVVKTDSTKY